MNDNEYKPTKIDKAWAAKKNLQETPPTKVDPAWAAKKNSQESPATKVDPAWAAKKNSQESPHTKQEERVNSNIDTDLHKSAVGALDPKQIMELADAEPFKTVQELAAAVSACSELVSEKGTKYTVDSIINDKGGEGAVLLCTDPNGNKVAAKVYNEPANKDGSSIDARSKVLKYMATEDGKKYTVTVNDIGLLELNGSRFYFEIMPYCSEGDLAKIAEKNKGMSFDEIVKITVFLNEALHSMHTFGVLHRDIKPENIYRLDGRYVIGDFGVAKEAISGVAAATYVHVGTEGYAGPETLMPVAFYTSKNDYYSLGITLASLFEGHFIYKELSDKEIAAHSQNEYLPLNREDENREKLENLIKGLCRNDTKNRFDYEEVNKWLKDHNYTGSSVDYTGGSVNGGWPKKLRAFGKDFTDGKSFFDEIIATSTNWETAKGSLYDNSFANFFSSFDLDLKEAAKNISNNYRAGQQDKGLSVFLNKLYPMSPIVWRGVARFETPQIMAETAMKAKSYAWVAEMLQNECVSFWMENTEGLNVDKKTIELMKRIEAHSKIEPAASCYWFANCFAKEKNAQLYGKSFSNIPDMIETLFRSPEDFYLKGGLELFFDEERRTKLFGFIYSFGYKELAADTYRKIVNFDMFQKTAAIMSMLDIIAEKSNANPEIVRTFFVKYGPVGAAIYTQQLVNSTQKTVYRSLDSDGANILKKISDFRAPDTAVSVSELYNGYLPLIENIKRMKAVLIDNPFLVVSGAYENKGIICEHLSGVFNFKFLELNVPAGFSVVLDNA